MDTTGHLVTSLLWFLSMNPKYLEIVKNEIYSNIKLSNSSSNSITYEAISTLKFLEACINETLRLMPPVPILTPRMAIKDHYLGDLFIKAGTTLFMPVTALPFGRGIS